MTVSANNQLMVFQTFASVLMGCITGLLIVFPIVLSAGSSPLSLLAFGAGLASGGLIGYRNRGSRGFLYLCFVAILVLAGTLSSSLTEIPTP